MLCEDPDAPRGTWLHWLIWNLPADAIELKPGVPPSPELPSGARQGLNDSGDLGYSGPCPPPGKPHRYFFRLLRAGHGTESPAGRESLRPRVRDGESRAGRGNRHGNLRAAQMTVAAAPRNIVMRTALTLSGFAVASLLACGGQARGPEGAKLPEPSANATLYDSTGARVGLASFTDAKRHRAARHQCVRSDAGSARNARARDRNLHAAHVRVRRSALQSRRPSSTEPEPGRTARGGPPQPDRRGRRQRRHHLRRGVHRCSHPGPRPCSAPSSARS